MIQVSPEDEFTFVLNGKDLQILIAGLGELPHKIAQPLEMKLGEQIHRQRPQPAQAQG